MANTILPFRRMSPLFPTGPMSILNPSQPIKVDYSDLYDTMAFFAGYPNGHPGHDDLAERIALNGMRFTREHWRWEDMQAYVRFSSLCASFLPMLELTSDPLFPLSADVPPLT